MRFHTSRDTLCLDLSNNQLTGCSFTAVVFEPITRPLQFILGHNRIRYLEEAVFRPLLESEPRSVIEMKHNKMSCDANCTACESSWLLRSKEVFRTQALKLNCSDGSDFWQLDLDEHARAGNSKSGYCVRL